jgi:hypothetical protein
VLRVRVHVCVCVCVCAVCDNIYVLCVRIFYESVYGDKERRNDDRERDGGMGTDRKVEASFRRTRLFIHIHRMCIIYERYSRMSCVLVRIWFGGPRPVYTSSDFYPRRFVSRVSHNNSVAIRICKYSVHSCASEMVKIYILYTENSVFMYIISSWIP